MANEINRSEKNFPPPFGKRYWLGPPFDPHKSFLHLPCFWWPFTIILLLSVLAGWKVVVDNELVFGISPRLEQWYEWFKIPLWILALLIPVLGLLNANHKSEQARAQMELTKAQNNFANYYKHLEEFTKFIKEESKHLGCISNVQIQKLHNNLFPNCRAGEYKVFYGPGSAYDSITKLHSATKSSIFEIYNLARQRVEPVVPKSLSQKINQFATIKPYEITVRQFFNFNSAPINLPIGPNHAYSGNQDAQSFALRLCQNYYAIKLIETGFRFCESPDHLHTAESSRYLKLLEPLEDLLSFTPHQSENFD